jgi:hypothetical protein
VLHVINALPAWLPAFLSQQRWFGSKGRTIARCEIEDLVELPTAVERGAAVVIARCQVDVRSAVTSAAFDLHGVLFRA